jgi:hypothetical protein
MNHIKVKRIKKTGIDYMSVIPGLRFYECFKSHKESIAKGDYLEVKNDGKVYLTTNNKMIEKAKKEGFMSNAILGVATRASKKREDKVRVTGAENVGVAQEEGTTDTPVLLGEGDVFYL